MIYTRQNNTQFRELWTVTQTGLTICDIFCNRKTEINYYPYLFRYFYKVPVCLEF